MAKSFARIKARKLRKQGKSIKEIAKLLGVSQGSASIWCRDISLSSEQVARLQLRIASKGSYEARLRGARVQHERRLEQVEVLRKEGSQLIGLFSKRDMLLIGASLYWGEGMKKQGRARIANSDPAIIKFMVRWFREIWGIPKSRLTFQVLINEIHTKRLGEVERYWSNVLGVSQSQFTKTTLIKAKNKKIYENFSKHYGTIIASVRRGGDLRHKINGIIDAFSKSQSC